MQDFSTRSVYILFLVSVSTLEETMKNKILTFVKVSFISIILILQACTASRGDLNNTALSLSLDIDANPAIGEVIPLIIGISGNDISDQVRIEVSLPEGMQLVDGSLTWEEDLSSGLYIQRNLNIRVLAPGLAEIIVNAAGKNSSHEEVVTSKSIYVYSQKVQEDRGKIRKPEKNKEGQGEVAHSPKLG
jgi:hypothetical protein